MWQENADLAGCSRTRAAASARHAPSKEAVARHSIAMINVVVGGLDCLGEGRECLVQERPGASCRGGQQRSTRASLGLPFMM